MLSSLSGAYLLATAISIVTSTVIKPSITNSSGEYYIASESAESFIGNAIHCDPKYANSSCHIICPFTGSCNNTLISCPNSVCDLRCTAPKACVETVFNITSTIKSAVNVFCSDIGSCTHTTVNANHASASNSLISTFINTCTNKQSCVGNSLSIRNFLSVDITHRQCEKCFANVYNLDNIENINITRNATNSIFLSPWYGYFTELDTIYSITNSKNINLTCDGNLACLYYQMNTSHTVGYSSSVSVDCHGVYACSFLSISQSPNDTLDLDLIHATFSYTRVIVSPLSAHTNVLCNGNASSQSCTGLSIMVPPHYETDFISFNFVNDKGTNTPHEASFNDVSIACVDTSGQPTFCTQYTPFPLLYGSSNPSAIVGHKVYYNESLPYQYRFQSLLCKAGQECFIPCDGYESCANTFIDCEPSSTCHISCNDFFKCERAVIKAYGDEIDLQCANSKDNRYYDTACQNTTIWLPDSFTNGYLDVTSCNQYQSYANMQFMCSSTVSQFIWSTDYLRYICEKEECCPYTNTPPTPGNATCIDKECVIDCGNDWDNPYEPPFGCRGFVIDGRESNTLHLNCSSQRSCQNATIHCPINGACNIDCGAGSCAHAMIFAHQTNALHINCADYAACNHAEIMASAVDTLTLSCGGGCTNASLMVNTSNTVDIHCTSCIGFKLHETSNRNVQFLCDGNCKSMQLYSRFGDHTSVLCNASFACSRADIHADSTKHFLVECDQMDELNAYACNGAKIFANAIDDLKVNCYRESCVDTHLTALGNMGNISWSCNDDQSCNRLHFNATNMSRVTLECSGWVSCWSDTFHITNTRYLNVASIYSNEHAGSYGIITDTDFRLEGVSEILFDCRNGACSGVISANNSNNIDVLCGECAKLQMTAVTVSDSVRIWCNGSSACTQAIFETYLVENMVNLTCGGTSCEDTVLDARTANQLNVFAYSADEYSNSDLTVFTPQTANATNIYCVLYGCLEERFVTSNGLSDINFVFSGECKGKSLDDCVSKWVVSCTDDEVTFDGNECAGSSSCCSDDDLHRVKNAFDTNCPAPQTNGHGPDYGLAAAITAVVVVVIIIAVIGGLFCYKRRIVVKEIQAEQYQQIND